MIGDSTEAIVTAEPQLGASTSGGSSTSANGNGKGQSCETIGAKRKREQAGAEAEGEPKLLQVEPISALDSANNEEKRKKEKMQLTKMLFSLKNKDCCG